MAGGNDGLNTVMPYTDALYHQMRPTIGYSGCAGSAIGWTTWLHPNLAPLKKFWDAGHMAVVEGVGYPNQSLSHFQAMDIWQTLDLNGVWERGLAGEAGLWLG